MAIVKNLKKAIRIVSSQRIDSKKINLIEEGIKLGIDKVIRPNGIINDSLKPQI